MTYRNGELVGDDGLTRSERKARIQQESGFAGFGDPEGRVFVIAGRRKENIAGQEPAYDPQEKYRRLKFVPGRKEKLSEAYEKLKGQLADESDAGAKYQEIASLLRGADKPEMARELDEIAANEFGHYNTIRVMANSIAKELK
jgi:hypothetical protein